MPSNEALCCFSREVGVWQYLNSTFILFTFFIIYFLESCVGFLDSHYNFLVGFCDGAYEVIWFELL
jgi:hypothetical protein